MLNTEKVGITIAGSVDTLKTFVALTNSTAMKTGTAPFRMRDDGGWGPRYQKGLWYRGYVTYQNEFPQPGSYDINGHVIISPDGGPTYIGYISGTNESNLSVVWNEIQTKPL